MNLIIGKRRSGKTTTLIENARKEGFTIAVQSLALAKTLSLRNRGVDFISFSEVGTLTNSNKKIWVDDMDLFIQRGYCINNRVNLMGGSFTVNSGNNGMLKEEYCTFLFGQF